MPARNGVDPAAACWPRCPPWPVADVCERSPSTLPAAAEEGAAPVKWLAVSQAETARASPTTVAATHMPLCRRLDGGGDGLRCRIAVLVRADGGGDTTRCRTAVLVRAD